MDSRRSTLAAVALTALLGCAPTASQLRSTTSNPYTEPRENAITFWGHACAYVDVDGFGILTDPVFSSRYAFIRKRLIPAPPASAYDEARVVLISHAHQDHADPKTLRQLPANVLILAPAPAARYLRRKGLRVRTMIPGDEYRYPGGSIIAVRAHHPGPRLSLKARSDGRAIGYVIRTREGTIYYTGDTEYFEGLAEIGRRYAPDVVLVNVNAHLHSQDALAALADVDAPLVIPMHLGAYDGKSASRGPRWRAALVRALGARVVPLEVGQSLALSQLSKGPSEP